MFSRDVGSSASLLAVGEVFPLPPPFSRPLMLPFLGRGLVPVPVGCRRLGAFLGLGSRTLILLGLVLY